MKRNEFKRFKGRVLEGLSNAMFRVQTEEGGLILAQVAGRLRVRRVRVLPGDSVEVETSIHDLSRGRIVTRFR